MPIRARLYMVILFCIAAALSAFASRGFSNIPTQWTPLLVLAVLASATRFLKDDPADHHIVSPDLVFFFAGFMLLQPSLFCLLVIGTYSIELLKHAYTAHGERSLWRSYVFAASAHIITGMIMFALYGSYAPYARSVLLFSPMFAGIVTALLYAVCHRQLAVVMLALRYQASWKDARLMLARSWLTEAVMACLGFVIAVLWQIDPWMIVPALASLIPMYQAARVPQLQQEASTDAKTGLMNARYFEKRFIDELGRAQRFERPLACIMTDIDLLRSINNTYGHLAGDTVLSDIGQIIGGTMRDYDVAARFGGEEFAIILPETNVAEARVMAERIRSLVEQHQFQLVTQTQPIRATMSFGIAAYPQDGVTTKELYHVADVAMYQAKQQGRNRVVATTDIAYVRHADSSRQPSSDDPPAPGEPAA